MERLGYVRSLDGLRGVAIALVVAYHAGWLRGGFLGVDVFFTLSGFLITSLLLEELDRDGRVNTRAFYVRRARRLLPALIALLAVVTLVERGGDADAALAGLFYVANIVRAAGHPDTLAGPLGHLWSLAQEEQFYLIWPLALVALARRNGRRAICAAIALLIAYRVALLVDGVSRHRLYYAPDTHADPLLIGCLLAFVRIKVRPVVGTAALGGVIALGAAVGIFSTFALAAGTTIVAALTALAISSPPRVLSVAPLVWLGRISYSLYLWHQFVREEIPNSVAAVAVAVLVACFSYRFIERPLRRRRARPVEALPQPAH